MIKTTTKKAINNIKNYILDNFDSTNYGIEIPNNFEDVARFIYNDFMSTYYIGYETRRNKQESFINWCQGLPSCLDTCYYYNRSAKNDLALILEETEEEKNKFTEEKACYMLTALIYREIIKVIERR